MRGETNPAWSSWLKQLWAHRVVMAILMVILAVPVLGHAQGSTLGQINGTVVDATGASVPNATVTVINNGTKETFKATSTGQGNFVVSNLPVGTYTVRVEASTFKTFVENNVEVHGANNTAVEATMAIGSTGETVNVEANAVQVETTSAAVGEVINGAQVRELPLNGENFVGLTQLSPGVSAASSFDATGKGLSGGVNFSVNGNPYTNNLFLIDGVNNNDMGSGRTILVYPSVFTIAEFKMIRNSYGPEYGQASGAIISITTKGGTNQFHGGLFYSGRNDALDTNNYFFKQNGTGKQKLRRSDYGYQISGPALKDRLFFWWNQEWNNEIRGYSYGTCVPTLAESAGNFTNAVTGHAGDATSGYYPVDQCGAQVGTYSNPKDFTSAQVGPIPTAYAGANAYTIANPDKAGLLIAQFYPAPTSATVDKSGYNFTEAINNNLKWSEWNVRTDFDVTKSNRITFRWTNDSWKNPAPLDPTAYWGTSALPTVQSAWSQPSKSVMVKLSSTLSNTLVNEAAFGYGYNQIVTTLAGTRANIVPALQAAMPPSWPASLKQPDEFFGGWGGLNPYGSYGTYSSMWNIAPYGDHEDLYTVQDNLSKVSGNHLFKVGGFWSANDKVENSGNGADRPTLPTSVFTGAGAAGVATNNPLVNILIPGTSINGAAPQKFNESENNIDGTAHVHWHDYEFYVQDEWKVRRNVTFNYGFRWSFYREPFAGDNQWANWSLSDWNRQEALANPSDACNGTIIVPGTTPCQNQKAALAALGISLPLSNGTPGPNRALVNQANHNIAPRLGLAWDVHGDGKTAVRLGFGQFYQREIVGIDEGMARTAPFVINASSVRSLDTPTQLTNPQVSPNYGKNPRALTPNSWQWNSTLEQQLARNTTLEVSYVGNVGVHLTSMYDLNAVQQSNWGSEVFANTSQLQNSYRPAFNFGTIGGFAREGHASYHSLQTLFRSQMGPSTFQAAYTWGHSIGNVELDNSSGGFNQQAATAPDTYPAIDKGNTNINRPSIFVLNEVYYLPKLEHSNFLVRGALGGWEGNSIFTAAHGSSLTVFANGSYNSGAVNGLIGTGYNGNDRPLLVSGQSCNAGAHGSQILNPNAFTLVGYTLGTIPTNMAHRGSCYGAPTTDWDAQLAKNWTFREIYRLKFSMDFFDLLNHPNFNTSNLEGSGYTPSTIYCGGTTQCGPNNPNHTVTGQSTLGGGFGVASALQAGHGNRELQYSLQFSF